MISTSEKTTPDVNIVPLRKADPAKLMQISQDGLLSLTIDEMKAIQAYFEKEGRDPTDGELETLAQTWSEHCNHKTLKASYVYSEKLVSQTPALAADGARRFDNLLKETIVKATEKLKQPWCLSVFKDNAGIIDFDETDGIAFKAETHNHPSALEPYGGAGTGIGGVIRDIMGVGLGAKPIMNTDVFCFGPVDTPNEKLPEGALHPRRIARGVVSGVRDYGNRMGIPTANGSINFDYGYTGNPLVFCGTVGKIPKKYIEKHVQPGDLVVAVGGRTGRDGIHGATFSSAPLESGITSNVVQIGHAIMEKKILDVLLAARDKDLYRSVTDCGAGGFSSAVGELGAETGVRVQLENAPLKYPGLKPWEIWVSESQERMVLVVPPENWNSIKQMFESEDVEATVIGEFTDNHRLEVNFGDTSVVNLDMDFLHDGYPKLTLNAVWDEADHRMKHQTEPIIKFSKTPETLKEMLGAVLSHPNVASKETVIRQYDHEVQGGSVIKPLMGVEADAPTDAAVIRPKLESYRGVVIGCGLQIEAGKKDPYAMAQYAIDEAFRNVICVGGRLHRVALLDNFCWGDAKDPLELAGLVRASLGAYEYAHALGLPFISGKDSLNNTWKTAEGKIVSIPPTLLISAVGIIDDIRECLTPQLKKPGNLLYLVGETVPTLSASVMGAILGKTEGPVAPVHLETSRTLFTKVRSVVRTRLVQSLHDVSDGGWIVSLVEMAFGGGLGASITLPSQIKSIEDHLFSESPSRFVAEVSPENKTEFEAEMGARNILELGVVSEKPNIVINDGNKDVLNETIKSLKSIWKKSLSKL